MRSPSGLILDELEVVARREAALRGYEFDVQIASRLLTAMVVAVALLDDWMFPLATRRPTRRRIVDEMVSFALYGLARRNPLPETYQPGT